jgi:hypothetical protein
VKYHVYRCRSRHANCTSDCRLGTGFTWSCGASCPLGSFSRTFRAVQLKMVSRRALKRGRWIEIRVEVDAALKLNSLGFQCGSFLTRSTDVYSGASGTRIGPMTICRVSTPITLSVLPSSRIEASGRAPGAGSTRMYNPAYRFRSATRHPILQRNPVPSLHRTSLSRGAQFV